MSSLPGLNLLMPSHIGTCNYCDAPNEACLALLSETTTYTKSDVEKLKSIMEEHKPSIEMVREVIKASVCSRRKYGHMYREDLFLKHKEIIALLIQAIPPHLRERKEFFLIAELKLEEFYTEKEISEVISLETVVDLFEEILGYPDLYSFDLLNLLIKNSPHLSSETSKIILEKISKKELHLPPRKESFFLSRATPILQHLVSLIPESQRASLAEALGNNRYAQRIRKLLCPQ